MYKVNLGILKLTSEAPNANDKQKSIKYMKTLLFGNISRVFNILKVLSPLIICSSKPSYYRSVLMSGFICYLFEHIIYIYFRRASGLLSIFSISLSIF